MEERNPYAAPKAPLFTDNTPKSLPTEADLMEYGGFWRRVGATLLDSLILAPMGLALMVAVSYTHLAYLYYSAPSVVIFLVYEVYLVKRFGGTPGKRILGMRVTNLDGTPVTLKTAFIRYSPMFALTVLASIASAITALNLGGIGFEDLSYFEKMKAVSEHQPRWNMPLTWATQAWYLVGAITLAANTRKRAVHDFIAGTVVLRDG
jgi:uncharacterized RDD family membrane protein YckC